MKQRSVLLRQTCVYTPLPHFCGHGRCLSVAVTSSLNGERKNFFSSSGFAFGGGDSMNYITFEQLMQFSGVVLSLVTTIFVILSFNKKK